MPEDDPDEELRLTVLFLKETGEESMKLLFTGFEPFGSEKMNPSWEAVKRLPNEIDLSGGRKLQLAKRRLPVE